MMIEMPASNRHLGTGEFAAILRQALASLPECDLPFAGDHGGRLEPGSIGVTILSMCAVDTWIEARIGVFFSETVGGCSCGEEPFISHGYRELGLRLHRASGVLVFNEEA